MNRIPEKTDKCTIGVDFGNTLTKLTINTGSGSNQSVPVAIPDFSRKIPQGEERFAPVIPSVIHYTTEDTVLVGKQVTDLGLLAADGTVRWMAHYANLGSPVRFRIGRRVLSYQVAAADFLSRIIRSTAELYQLSRSDLVVAVPPGCSDRYTDWLTKLNTEDIISRVRVIEQPSAVVSSCLDKHTGNITFMIIDFGGSALDVSVITRFFEDGESRYRIVGDAHGSIGGRMLDRLLLRFAAQNACMPYSDQPRRDNRLQECEKAKENLTTDHATEIFLEAGKKIRITRRDFEELLTSEGVYTMFSSTIQQAMDRASSRGYNDHSISSVILVGGSGAIPSFQELVKSRFGAAKVISDGPLDVVSRGASAGCSGYSPFRQINHNYAIRVWNSAKGAFEFRTVIPKGCPDPPWNSALPAHLTWMRDTGGAIQGAEIFAQWLYPDGRRVAGF
jgi:molecular chaperone DnaK